MRFLRALLFVAFDRKKVFHRPLTALSDKSWRVPSFATIQEHLAPPFKRETLHSTLKMRAARKTIDIPNSAQQLGPLGCCIDNFLSM
jgi:hypothetical protein